jgi:ribosomal protein L7/L12
LKIKQNLPGNLKKLVLLNSQKVKRITGLGQKEAKDMVSPTSNTKKEYPKAS